MAAARVRVRIMTENTQSARQVSTVPQDPEDEIILDRYFSGDQQAMSDLVDRYAARLYNFGKKMCGNSEDAQDLVQDTFLNVVKYLKGFRSETKLKNWIYRLASSACIKKWRARSRPERELSLEDLRPPDSEGQPEIPDWSQNPVDDLMNEELRNRIAQAIVRLPQQVPPGVHPGPGPGGIQHR